MPEAPQSSELDRFIVRLPDGMRDELKQRAKENMRSMNAEVVFLLTKALAEKPK